MTQRLLNFPPISHKPLKLSLLTTLSTPQESSCHDTLAVRLCNQILETPDAFSNRTMCRILTQLEISGNNPSSLKALAVLCQQMTEVRPSLDHWSSTVLTGGFSLQQVKDKQSLKYLEKFQGSIQELASKTNTVLDTPYSRLKEQSTVQAQPGRSQSEAVSCHSILPWSRSVLLQRVLKRRSYLLIVHTIITHDYGNNTV